MLIPQDERHRLRDEFINWRRPYEDLKILRAEFIKWRNYLLAKRRAKEEAERLARERAAAKALRLLELKEEGDGLTEEQRRRRRAAGDDDEGGATNNLMLL